MANRSYLYSSDLVKGFGLSEWKYDIPLAYKILLSCNNQMTKSLIWGERDELIAIVGEYECGCEKLFNFLDRLFELNYFDENEFAREIKETKDFLNNQKNKNKFILLEAGEIFDMKDEAFENQNEALFKEISNIDQVMHDFIEKIRELKKIDSSKNILTKIFGNKKRKKNSCARANECFGIR